MDGVQLSLVDWDTYSYDDGYRRRFGFHTENNSLVITLVDYSGIGIYAAWSEESGSKYSQGYY